LQPASYVNLEIKNWHGSQMLYVVNTDKLVEVIQKTLYFPGWELKVDGQKKQINYQDAEFPGHITYKLNPGKHLIELIFTQHTQARVVGNWLTVAGFAGLVVYSVSVKKISQTDN
jgi:hypothetical protein